jgi:hypothetical protein
MVEARFLYSPCIRLVRVGGQGDQFDVAQFRLLAKPPSDSASVDSRHVDIEQQTVRPVIPCHLLGARAIVAHLAIISPQLEQYGKRVRSVTIIIDDEDAQRVLRLDVSSPVDCYHCRPLFMAKVRALPSPLIRKRGKGCAGLFAVSRRGQKVLLNPFRVVRQRMPEWDMRNGDRKF